MTLTPEQVRILVVDDDEHVGTGIERQLEEASYALTVLTDPLLAVKELSKQDYAMILSDNLMPGMNGLELLSIAMNLCPDTRRLLITGYTDLNDAVQAFNGGIIHRYIAKPWKRAELLAMVQEELDIYQAHIQQRQAQKTLEHALDRRTSLLKEAVGMIRRAEQELADAVDAGGVDRKLTVIVCGDVVGFSRLMGDDHEQTLAMLAECRERLGVVIRRYNGRLVDAVGDSVLAEFASVLDAVGFATEAQKELGTRNDQLAPERRMRFRFGISVGDVLVKDGSLYGDGVNVAARLQALAEPGGICLTGTAYDQIKQRLPITCHDLGEQSLKNIQEPVRVYAIECET